MFSTVRRASLTAKAKLLVLPLTAALVLGVAIGSRDRDSTAAASTASTPPASSTQTPPTEPTRAPFGKRSTPALPDTPSLSGVWMLLLALAAGGVAIVVAAKRTGLARAGNGQLAVVDSIALGPKRLVHLVRCGDRRYLLASSEAGVSCLASLPQELHEAEMDAVAQGPDADSEFRRMLEPAGSRA